MFVGLAQTNQSFFYIYLRLLFLVSTMATMQDIPVGVEMIILSKQNIAVTGHNRKRG